MTGCDQQSSLVDVAGDRAAVQTDLNAASNRGSVAGVSVVSSESNTGSHSIDNPEEADVRTVSAGAVDGIGGGGTMMLVPPRCEDPLKDPNCDDSGGGGGGGGGPPGGCGPSDYSFHWVMATDVDNMGVYTNYVETQSYTGATVQVYYLWVGHEVWVNGAQEGYFTEDIYCDVNTNYYVGWTDPDGLQLWEAEGSHKGQANDTGTLQTFLPTHDAEYL